MPRKSFRLLMGRTNVRSVLSEIPHTSLLLDIGITSQIMADKKWQFADQKEW